MEDWPIVTDDNFEDALPNFESSKKRLHTLIEPLEEGKVVSLAGFLGATADGLETILGRGGSDLTAVFASCLLKDVYQTKTLLYKDVPVQSADPKVVKGQKTEHVNALTYNEAHKASMMGMKIVQSPAIAMARQFGQPLMVVPIDEPKMYSIIEAETKGGEVVKCLTGKSGCAILSMNDEKSRSLEDSLRIWERRNDFMDLGAETMETGERIRDFLFLDSDFLKKNEEKLKGFDEHLKIDYGLGVVTLIGDRMKNSPGVASIAISAISGINIKRGIFAPHTSQIILVVEEKNVNATVAAIHQKEAGPKQDTAKLANGISTNSLNLCSLNLILFITRSQVTFATKVLTESRPFYCSKTPGLRLLLNSGYLVKVGRKLYYVESHGFQKRSLSQTSPEPAMLHGRPSFKQYPK